MNCSNHVDREAVAMCVRCNKFICKECAVKINNKYYCKDCVSEMYSNNNYNTNNINTEKVREYADKVVNVTKDVADEALNLVKDFSNSEEVKNIVNDAKENNKIVNYILGVIAIILLIPKLIKNVWYVINIFENIYLSFRYNEVIRGFIFLINAVISFIQPTIIILFALLLFNNFIKLNRRIRIGAPILILILFTIARFVLGNIAIRFIDFTPIIDMFSYIIPVGLIVMGSYLDR